MVSSIAEVAAALRAANPDLVYGEGVYRGGGRVAVDCSGWEQLGRGPHSSDGLHRMSFTA
jgi:hypothetical protein